MRNVNRQILLARRPQGMPQESDFKLVENPIPEPGGGQVLLRLLWLSVDPYMRGRISGVKSYAKGVDPGELMVGGGVGQVVRSNHPGFKPGEFATTMNAGWQDYAALPGEALRKVDPADGPIEHAVGIYGLPGLTAYFALLDIGQPKAGETVVVSSASGAVGQAVGQIAKMKGCRTVAIAGSDAKLAWCRELGFDAGVNYKTAPDLKAALAAACPKGVDVFFDNVGGTIHDAAMALINLHARIIICGNITLYNRPGEPDIGLRHLRAMLVNRATMRGFLLFDYADRYDAGIRELVSWVKAGRIKYRYDVIEGLERAPQGLIRLLTGANFGKQLVKIAEPA